MRKKIFALGKITAIFSLIWVLLSGLILTFISYFWGLSLFESKVFQKTQIIGFGIGDSFMKVVSFLGNKEVAALSIIFFAALFYFQSLRREAKYIIFTIPALIFSFLIKNLVGRPRPNGELDSLLIIKDYSFPSSHVVYYVVFYGFLLILMLRIKTIPLFLRYLSIALAVALLLFGGISRIYLGAHWALDVLGGYLFGTFYLAVLIYFYFLGIRNNEQA